MTDLPHVTHEGAFTIFGKTLRCYRLSDGSAVFNADDFEAFFNDMFSDGAIEPSPEDDVAIQEMMKWMKSP